MFFLTGVARYLFVPLAEAVVFAMLASYILSRTLVPTLAMYLLKAHEHGCARSRNPFVLFQRAFERGFERLRLGYRAAADGAGVPRGWFSCRRFWPSAARRSCWFPGSARISFPTTDSGQFILHLRAKTGTRIEETARLCDLVENSIRREHSARRDRQHPRQHRPALQPASISCYSTSGVIGAGDADILVSLKAGPSPHRGLRPRSCAARLPANFPA